MTAITPGLVTIEAFVPIVALWDGTYCPDSTYYVEARPLARRQRPAATAAGDLTVLLRALREDHVAALVNVALEAKPARYAAILPDKRLLGLAFAHEVSPPPRKLVARAAACRVREAREVVRAIGIATPVLEDNPTALGCIHVTDVPAATRNTPGRSPAGRGPRRQRWGR